MSGTGISMSISKVFIEEVTAEDRTGSGTGSVLLSNSTCGMNELYLLSTPVVVDGPVLDSS